MMNLFYHPWAMTLAQLIPPTFKTFDENDPAKTPPPPKPAPLSFSDLQQGMRNWRTEEPNNAVRNWLLMGVVLLAVLVLIVQMHQRMQKRKKGLVDSEWALFRELTRGVPLPWGSSLLLWWMAHGAGVSIPALLLSPSLYRNSAKKWSAGSTLSVVRRLGLPRVERMERMLFQ